MIELYFILILTMGGVDCSEPMPEDLKGMCSESWSVPVFMAFESDVKESIREHKAYCEKVRPDLTCTSELYTFNVKTKEIKEVK